MLLDRYKRMALLCCATPLAGVLAGSVLAQQAGSATAAMSESTQLSEITVTAEKRESTVQNTPISLTAISSADLAARGATDITSLLASVPGVSIRSSGPGLTEFEMRGMSSTGGNSPTVGFYYDDTLLTATSDANEGKVVISPALYDVSRIEVLRGPQGTLYGSGSMGGTIKVVPNAPQLNAFDASGELVMGGTEGGGFNHAENGMVNLPLGSIAAVRVVGSYEDDSGWIARIVTQPGTFPLATDNNMMRGNVAAAPVADDHKGVNETARTTLRISALIQPTDGLSITPAFFYQKTGSGGLPYIDSNPGNEAHYQPFDVPESIHELFKLSSLKLAYRTDAFEVDSNTAYWNRFQTVPQDASESWQTGAGVPAFLPADGGLGAAVSQEYNYSRQTTEELRISSVGDSSFKWLAGYFYQDLESVLDIYYPVQNGDVFGSNVLFVALNPDKLLQQSVFGEATYNFTQALAATVGVRRYYYDQTTSQALSGPFSGDPAPTSVGEKDQGVTPKFSLSYTFSPDLLVYGTGSKGFRPGGGTGPVPASGPGSCEQSLQLEYGSTDFVPGPTSFKSDHVWSYELGEKLRAADNRISINTSFYFESWTGVQQLNTLPCGFQYTANSGNAHIYGGEFEIRAVVLPELVASLNTGYTHAALVSADLQHSVFAPGTPLQDDPKWTGSASLAYRHPLNDLFALTARVDTNYVGARTDTSYSINTLSSYQLTNIRGGLEGKQWSAVMFVNNVANKHAHINDINIDAINLADYNRIATNQPLTAGIDLNYRY